MYQRALKVVALPIALTVSWTARSGRAHGCVVAAEIEAHWGRRGQWVPTVPAPATRHVAATDSIGVWLERVVEPSGAIEWRRVTATETRVTRQTPGECALTHHRYTRTFEALPERALTDDRLRDVMQATPQGIVYVWSPRMPLSVLGLGEARAAARAAGLGFIAVLADVEDSGEERRLLEATGSFSLDALELVYRNATQHYPSVVVYSGGAPVGGAIPGYRSAESYLALIQSRLARGSWPEASAPTRLWLDRSARPLTVSTTPTVRPVGFFFKPVSGTDLVAYTSGDTSFLFDLRSRRERRIPGRIDPIPTPDGRFVTLPGLRWHSTAALLEGDTLAIASDSQFYGDYQTAAIQRPHAGSTRYRVITAFANSVQYRDYLAARDPRSRTPTVRPMGPVVRPCANRHLALPINSKFGDEIGAFDVDAETYQLLRLGPKHCDVVLNIGFPTGKIAFSHDGGRIAFATARINSDTSGALLRPNVLFFKDAFVLDRATHRVVQLSDNRRSRSMTFPEFLPNGHLILLDQRSRLHREEVFRIVEVK